MAKMSKQMRKILSIGMLATTAVTSVAPSYAFAVEQQGDIQTLEVQSKKSEKSTLKIAVATDLHVFPEEYLGNEGPNYQAYVNGDRKMLKESMRILDATIERLKNSDADIVLIAGDLTKDSEILGHNIVAEKLAELEKVGKQVFVTNGNHDINAPDAEKFVAVSGEVDDENRVDRVEKIDGIMQDEFEELYSQFGFNDKETTLASDPNSTSYVAKLAEGYRLIVMDTGMYGDSKDDQSTSGHLENGRLEWILKQVEEAKAAGDTVIGMSHHGIVEHFDGQGTVFAPYLVKDYENISTILADAGMEYVFTGHFHAQDVAVKTTEAGNTIMDIMTGSTVSYPSPIRFVEIDGDAQKIDIKSERISSIEGIPSFEQYSEKTMEAGVPGMVSSLLAGILNDLVDSLFPAGEGLPEDESLINEYMYKVIEEEVKSMLESNPELADELLGQDNVLERSNVVESDEAVIEDEVVEDEDTAENDEIVEDEDITENDELVDEDVVVEDGEETDKEEIEDEDLDSEEMALDIEAIIKRIFTKEKLNNYINAVCKGLETVTISTSIVPEGEEYKFMDAITHCLMEVYKGDEVFSDDMKTLREELESKGLVQEALVKVLVANKGELENKNWIDNTLIGVIFNENTLNGLFGIETSEGGPTVGGVIGSAFGSLLNGILNDDTPDNNAIYIDGKITTATVVEDKITDIEENINRSEYTASSLAVLDAALAKARAIIADESSTQEDIEEAMAELCRAVNGLTVKSTSGGGSGSVTPTITFTDIQNHWAKDAILRFTNKGYIEGYGDNTFKPENSITRAEFTKLVNRACGFTSKGNADFGDVSSDAWYYDEIRIGVQAGYIDGYEDKNFKPDQPISREEAAKIIAKVTGAKGDGVIEFKDADKVSSWAKDYVDALSDKEIITGYEDNTFRPQNNITRAESVVMLDRVK